MKPRPAESISGDSPCLGRYSGDRYTPTGSVEDGGWPLCEACADVARWLGGSDSDAVADHAFEDAHEWTTTAGLLLERVDRTGDVRWNSNLRWSQATYLLLVENHVRDKAFGLAPAGARTERRRGRIPHEETGFSGRRRLAADFALFGRTCP